MSGLPIAGAGRRRWLGLLSAVPVIAVLQATAAPPSDAPPDAAVAVDRLPAIAVDAVGTPATAAAFGEGLWRGVRRADVMEDLARLPIDAASPTLQALQERLLTAAAVPPETVEGAPDGSFLAARLAALVRAGGWESVLDLVQRVPVAARTSAIARPEVEARLLTGDLDGACRVVRNQVERGDAADPADPEAAFWLRALALCQKRAGEDAAAALSLSLLREAGVDDPRFSAVLDRLPPAADRPRVALQDVKEPDPLLVAAVRASTARVPLGWAEAGQPWLARTVADDVDLPIGERLVAAERAHAAGAIPVDLVRGLYRETAAEMAGDSATVAAARERAAAFRAAAATADDRARADAVIAALEAGRETGRYAPTAEIYAEILAGLAPELRVIDRAGEVVPALLVVGAEESAVEWLAAAEAESEHNSAALAALTATAPYIAVLDPAGVAEGHLANWAEHAEAGGAARAAVLAAAIDGLGGRVPPDLAAAAAPAKDTAGSGAAPAAPDPAAGSLGEPAAPGATLLTVLDRAQADGPGRWDAATVGRSVAALRRLGLEEEARGLAVEALAARAP